MGFVLNLVETDGFVTETDCDDFTIRQEHNGVDYVFANDALLGLHLGGVVDADFFHLCFKHDHLVNLFEIVYFLDLVFMRHSVDNLS